MNIICRYESKIVTDWKKNITAELADRLKQPLLVSLISNFHYSLNYHEGHVLCKMFCLCLISSKSVNSVLVFCILQLAEDYDEDEDIRPQAVHVNLDPQLLMLLREIHYMQAEPFCLKLPGTARELLRNTNSKELRTTATRLETITSKYNAVMKSISEYELPLFERNLAKIDHVCNTPVEL